ncbi:MAG: hypothetical protein ABWY54_02270 [Glaciihabitans sp.]
MTGNLLQSLKTDDPDAVEAAMRAHMMTAGRRLERTLLQAEADEIAG